MNRVSGADAVHREGSGFCDAHVESISLKTLFAATNDAALSRWNKDHQPHLERLAP